MIPAAFEYVAPETLEQAVALLGQYGDEAKVLAGGHSLLPLMKLRLAIPAVLIDLRKLADLRYIREENGSIRIGAMTRYVDVEESAVIGRRLPLLAVATSQVGDMQVRNRGTLGGALAHSDPAGDMPSVVMALGGSVLAVGPGGEREIPLSDFFLDIFTPALEPDEILTEIRLTPQDGGMSAYEKFRRRQIDWAIVGVSVNLSRTNGEIDDPRIVLTNVGPTPLHATAVEDALRGRHVDTDLLAAAEQADEGLDPTPELNASSEYKRHLARVLTRRALEKALGTELSRKEQAW
jgi:aerobic carbon-monoxide dehydrogenase medium subunit